MLKEYIDNGFGIKEDLNCAEQILHGSNHIYELGLDQETLRLAGGFGGGMGVEDVCGVVTGASMVFSRMFIKDRARESNLIKEVNKAYITRFRERLGSSNCRELKDRHWCDTQKCNHVIVTGAEVLDEIVKEFKE